MHTICWVSDPTCVKTCILTLIDGRRHWAKGRKKGNFLWVSTSFIDLFLRKGHLIVAKIIEKIIKLVLITTTYKKIENHV